MTDWIRWAAPVAVVASVASPGYGYAAQYLTVQEAQKLAFPTANRFVEANVIFKPADAEAIEKLSGQRVRTRGEQVWKAQNGDRLLGFFILDYVIGKHLVIDYAIALEPDGKIKQVEILQYREPYGGEIRNPDWLAQFVGKSSKDELEVNKDIINISGATLSSRHVTQGIKRVLAFYEICLKENACGR